MSYFLFQGKLEVEKTVTLQGEEVQHILGSRRLRTGELLELQDQDGNRFTAQIAKRDRNSLSLCVQNAIPAPPPSLLQLELMQALPKEKALDWIIQKSTELGITRMIFFAGVYSPARANSSSQQKRWLRRWEKIALEACKQSGRRFPPEILWFQDLATALSQLAACSSQWVLDPESDQCLSPLSLREAPGASLQHRVLVGAEGGLHPDELKLAAQAGMAAIRLGPRTLRAETAVVSIVAIFQFLAGDLA